MTRVTASCRQCQETVTALRVAAVDHLGVGPCFAESWGFSGWIQVSGDLLTSGSIRQHLPTLDQARPQQKSASIAALLCGLEKRWIAGLHGVGVLSHVCDLGGKRRNSLGFHSEQVRVQLLLPAGWTCGEQCPLVRLIHRSTCGRGWARQQGGQRTIAWLRLTAVHGDVLKWRPTEAWLPRGAEQETGK